MRGKQRMAIVPTSTRDPGEQLSTLVAQVIELREVLVAMQRCPSLRSPSSLSVLVTNRRPDRGDLGE